MKLDGTLISRVLLDSSDIDPQDDWSIWRGASELFQWAMKEAQLRLGEFPEFLYNMNKVSFYIAQIDNGGHKQFAQNCNYDDDTVQRVETGLLGRVLN